jgi:hypothetical protein
VERVRPIPGAVALLELCAFLGPEEIPRDLFTQTLDPVPEELAMLAGDPFALDEAVAGLRRFGLVKADEEALTVHRLVQSTVRHKQEPSQEQLWATAALHLVSAAFPTDSINSAVWPIYARLLPHALAVTDHGARLGVDPEMTARLLTEAGSYLWQRADNQPARQLHERALRGPRSVTLPCVLLVLRPGEGIVPVIAGDRRIIGFFRAGSR